MLKRSSTLVPVLLTAATIFSLSPGLSAPAPLRPPVDFLKDVQPVLKASCYQCHGPDVQAAHLRLDVKKDVLGRIVVPGKSDHSLLMERVLGQGGKPRMPLGFAPLTPDQIVVLRRWIDSGAPWQDPGALKKHWAYVKPVRPAIPAVKDASWVRNPIDAFVLARLEHEGLHPSPEACREILLRRVYLDLTGLPPSIQEIDSFLADHRTDAYEKVVDRLLASPHYGERWARLWLDLARYADTNGYEKDSRRSMWPYRDWVINAFNKNMPFDEFTIEQIAGDMLPHATLEQKIASGFHRNTMFNDEGGVDREEQRWLTVVDRVGTTASVWMGTTLACAECHNHKYDPFTQKEYYQFFAFFDHADEPELKVPTPMQQARTTALESEIKVLKSLLASDATDLDKGEAAWEQTVSSQKPALKLSNNVKAALAIPAAKRTEAQKKVLSDYYRSLDPDYASVSARVASLEKQLSDQSVATTLVMQEKPGTDRPATFIHVKGSFLNKAEQVTADVPAILPRLPASEPPNRLGLAYWLVSQDNPLTARVTVNRFWEQCFGQGIVETSDDFGTQGSPPTHPKLLDWLATEFVRQHWNVKALLRLIVTSATYRQSSRMTPALREKDPANRLLARGPRFRLEAEMIRDASLTAGGLLSLKMGGPSVFPPQPDGIWSIPYSSDQWVTSPGEDRYRRGIYTFWRRTSPYPSFVTFDAPSREYCTIRRIRTNTPLQALTTLNDPAFFEAARGLARRMMRETGPTPASQVTYGFRICMARQPKPEELDRLVALYRQELAHFRADPKAAESISADPGAGPEMAAFTVTSNVLLNLDEFLTKE